MASLVIGEFLCETCPNEVIRYILEFVDYSTVFQFGETSKLFNMIAKSFFKNRKIDKETEIEEIIQNNPHWISFLLNVDGLDSTVVARMSMSMFDKVQFKREVPRNEDQGRRRWRERGNSLSYEELLKKYHDDLKSFEKKRKAILSIVANLKVNEQQRKEKFLERTILIPLLNRPQYIGHNFRGEVLRAMKNNPNYDFLCFNNLPLRMIFLSKIDDGQVYDFLENNPQFDPKKITFEMCYVIKRGSPFKRISRAFVLPDHLCSQPELKKQQKLRTSKRTYDSDDSDDSDSEDLEDSDDSDDSDSPEVEKFGERYGNVMGFDNIDENDLRNISWYDLATDPKKNNKFLLQVIKDAMFFRGWAFYDQNFINLIRKTLHAWKSLGLPIKINVHSVELILQKTSMVEFVMKSCEVVDRHLWYNTDSKVMNIYESLFTYHNKYPKMELVEELIKEYQHPFRNNDIKKLLEVSIRKEKRKNYLLHVLEKGGANFMEELFPKDWHGIENGKLVVELFNCCLDQEKENRKRMMDLVFKKISQQKLSIIFQKHNERIWNEVLLPYHDPEIHNLCLTFLDLFMKKGLLIDLRTFSNFITIRKFNNLNFIGWLLFGQHDNSQILGKEIGRTENREFLLELYNHSLEMFYEEKRMSRLSISIFLKRNHLKTKNDWSMYNLGYLFLFILASFQDKIPKEMRTYSYIFSRARCEGRVEKQLLLCCQFREFQDQGKMRSCKTCNVYICISCEQTCHKGHNFGGYCLMRKGCQCGRRDFENKREFVISCPRKDLILEFERR